MPRKKESIQAFGKSWSVVDLPNLEKAVKLMERLNYLNNNFANSLSGASAIQQQINEKTSIQNELQKLNYNLTEKQIKNIIQQLEGFKNITKELLNSKQALQLAHNKNSLNNSSLPNLSWSNVGSTYQGIRQQRDANNIYNNLLSDMEKKYGKQDTWSANTVKQFNNTLVSNMDGIANKYNKSASLLQVAADTFKKGVDIFVNLLTAGLNRQSSVYEDTFSNISFRTGISRSDYYGQQSSINNQLDDLGLRNNVASSEVQQMWNSLANAGMNSEDMFANAIDNVVTSKIVPYLDTTTQEFNLINQRLDGNFVKQIRGINVATQDLVDSSYMNEKVLNNMLSEMAPISDKAIQDLAKNSTQLSAMANYLMEEQGWTEDQATDYISMLYKQQQYGNDILTNGSTFEKLAYTDQLQSGVNIYTDMAGALNNILGTYSYVGKMLPGYTDTFNGLTTSTIANSLGMSFETSAAAVKAREGNAQDSETWQKILNLSNEDIEKYSNEATSNYSNDRNQTNKSLQNVTLENLMNELAVVNEWMGNWSDVIVTAVKGIATILTTGLIAKGIGALAGTAGGGTGTGLLAGLGIGGTAVAAIGLTVGTIAAIGSAVNGEFTDISDREAAKNAEELANSEDESVRQWATNGAWNKTVGDVEASKAQGGIKESFANAWGGIKTGWTKLWSSDYVEENKQFWEWMKSSGTFSEDENGYWQRIAAYYLWDKADSLDSISGVTREDLEQFAKQGYAKQIQSYANQIVESGWAPSDKDGNKVTADIDWASYGAPEGSYRYGLDSVPYDNYVASLHEGEAVLTASTANELRNLTDTYRETTEQSVNFETIIQDQTYSLITKLDQLITVVQGNNTTASNSVATTDQQTAWQTITNSMLHMTSTKSVK